ncbi:hypothetical protein VARIO8X_50205 [Burkholderiales bacterium 8X]|nr:hypothetical protein VARIO8X_50205 [Burkholderiales bacterium 8X]
MALAGGDATQISLGAQAGSNAAANNYMAHADASRMLSLANQCRTTCTPAQLEELANLFVKDTTTTKALQDCTGSSSALCTSIRKDFNAVAASFLPTNEDIRTWSIKQAEASDGKYSTEQIYDAYRVNFVAGAQPDQSQGDLTEVADWMRDRITGNKGDPSNPGEGPLSKIAMGWAVGTSASAQAALSVQTAVLAASTKLVRAPSASAPNGLRLIDLAQPPSTSYKDFNQARNAAIAWLEVRGFRAEAATMGKFGNNYEKPIGMKNADGKAGFRVEFDERNGAHINVWSGKEKGPHFTFDGDQASVNRIVKQFRN